MKKVLPIFLGVLSAIGGFVDMGDLVANSAVGARFGLDLAWVVVLGIVGICVYADMAGRVAAVSGRAVFDVIRERLGPRAAAVNRRAAAPPLRRTDGCRAVPRACRQPPARRP